MTLLRDNQLFLVESRDKEIGDPAQVDRRCLGQAGHTRIGQYDHDTTCVCTVPDFADAVRRHEVIAAIERSAASGERVKA